MRVGVTNFALLVASCISGVAFAQSSPTAVVYVYAEDGGSAPVAAGLADAMTKRAGASGRWRATTDKSVADLLDRSPEELARSANAVANARANYADGLEHNTRLRLELAQETLQRARAGYLDAALPTYSELRDVHLYLGVILFNQGHPDVATQHFRQAAFLSPSLALNRDVFSPSIVAAFELAKRGVSSGPKGSVRVEVDAPNATMWLDGVPKGGPRLLADIPEGDHYLEVRAPGAAPQLLSITVNAGSETPIPVPMRKAGQSLRQVWASGKGENGGVAIARILKADRFVLGAVRTTVAGMLPYTARAAAFESDSGRRFADAETGLSAANDTRVPRFIDALFGTPQVAVAGRAAVVSARSRFMQRDSTMALFETGFAYQNKVYDQKSRYVASNSWGEFPRDARDQDFDTYFETRSTIHLRYGLRDRITAVVAIPFYTKELHYEYDSDDNTTIEGGEADVKRKDSGIGDVLIGADVRIPRLEKGPLSLVYASGRVEMPTGSSSEACGFIRRYCSLVIGSGQWDVYLGLGGFIARDDFRFGFETGYNARLPDRVAYYNPDDRVRRRQHLDPGDEQRLHLDGTYHVGRWIAPELFLDVLRRDPTKKFENPITHRPGTAPEMYLAELGVAVRAEFTEGSHGGVVVQHPVWGKSTMTFFPLDVTGPRAYVYYGYRF